MRAFEKALNGMDKLCFVYNEAAKSTIDKGEFGGMRPYCGSYVIEDGQFLKGNLEEGKT